MNLDFTIKTHNRISRNLHKDNFYLVEHSTGDYIICEEYKDEQNFYEMDVNISRILNKNLSLERYVIFRYGKERVKKESSCFSTLKGQDFKKRKSDITLLIFDKKEEKVILICGEVKKTLKYSNMAEAREQLISSYIDLNVFNALLTFNYYPVESVFFVIYEQSRISSNFNSSSMLLGKYAKGKKNIPYKLLSQEYTRKKIYFNLDDDRLIGEANRKPEKIDNSKMMYGEWKFIQLDGESSRPL